MKYDVKLTATLVVRNIEADSKEDAELEVQEMLAAGEVEEGDADYDFEAKPKE